MLADEGDRGVERGAGAEDGGDPLLLEECHILFRNGAADDNQYVACALLFEQRGHAGHDGVVCTGEDAQTDAVDVFLEGGVDDHLRRLPEAGVDNLHTGVAQRPGDDLGSSVVAVQARLGDQDTDRYTIWGWGGFRHRTEENTTEGAARERTGTTSHRFAGNHICWL
jgi:hypothetical protein